MGLKTSKQMKVMSTRPEASKDDAHELMPKWLKAEMPELYSSMKTLVPMIAVKYFTPDSSWTWYGVEFDGEDLLWGLVVGFEQELGYFSLRELETARGKLGLRIERDLYFPPTPLEDLA